MQLTSMADLTPMKENTVSKALLQWVTDSRWRKKCKRSIKRARYQLLLGVNRMKCIIRQSRADIAQLIGNDDDHQAFVRVEKLCHDEDRLLAYGELEDFLVKIRIHLRQFSRNVDNLGLEIQEAVSSVVLAASCCGELVELRRMRDLFVRRFGDDLRRLTENFADFSIKRKLSERLVPDDVKHRLISEISKEYSIKIDIFEDHKQNNYEEDDFSTITATNQVHEPRAESVSVVQDKKDQVVTKRSVFHEVFRRMRSNFSLQARSSNLVTPHRDSYESSKADIDASKENIKGKHVADNGAFTREGLYEKGLIESKDESSHHSRKIVGNNDVNDNKDDGEDEKPRLSYVHPKLPDYDELVATFTEYKKECRKNTTKDGNNGVVPRWMPWLKVIAS